MAISLKSYHLKKGPEQSIGGSVKDESLGLETKGIETLGLFSVSYKILELVSSQMKNFGTASSQSRLVCFNFTQSRLGIVLIWMSSF